MTGPGIPAPVPPSRTVAAGPTVGSASEAGGVSRTPPADEPSSSDGHPQPDSGLVLQHRPGYDCGRRPFRRRHRMFAHRCRRSSRKPAPGRLPGRRPLGDRGDHHGGGSQGGSRRAAAGILLDPTHDFSTNTWHGLELLRCADELVATGWPVLMALSNKDFVAETLGVGLRERLEGSQAATAAAALAVPPCSVPIRSVRRAAYWRWSPPSGTRPPTAPWQELA